MNSKLKKHRILGQKHIKNYICLYFICIAIFSYSQEGLNIDPSVITGCGGSLQGYSMVSVKSDFTLGEIAIETLKSDQYMLTQGFHQPSLGIISLLESPQTKISIFPNPITDFLNLEFSNSQNEFVEIRIIDTSGKVIFYDFTVTGKNFYKINTTFLKLGTYILEIITEKEKDLFKIQKLK